MEPHVVFKINELLPTANKVVLPASQNSNVIYQFSSSCDSRYVGRTFQRFQNMIKQHVPKSILSGVSPRKRDLPVRECRCSTKSTTETQFLTDHLAIGFHLLRNPSCDRHYDNSMFFYSCKRLLLLIPGVFFALHSDNFFDKSQTQ